MKIRVRGWSYVWDRVVTTENGVITEDEDVGADEQIDRRFVIEDVQQFLEYCATKPHSDPKAFFDGVMRFVDALYLREPSGRPPKHEAPMYLAYRRELKKDPKLKRRQFVIQHDGIEGKLASIRERLVRRGMSELRRQEKAAKGIAWE